MTAQTQYCFVLKSGVPNPKIHKVKTGPVTWSDGRTEDHILPACGTRIDVCALETEWAYGIDGMGHAGDPCGKCFPKAKEAPEPEPTPEPDITYNGTVVNGYDAEGGLWFSREASSHANFERLVAEAKALPEVTRVSADFH